MQASVMASGGSGKPSDDAERMTGLVTCLLGLALIAVGIYEMTHLRKGEKVGDAIVYLMFPLMGIAAIAGGIAMLPRRRTPSEDEDGPG